MSAFYTTPQKPARDENADLQLADLIKGEEEIWQTSESVLDLMSPSCSALRSVKRKRSVLGEAARVMTPSKRPLPSNSDRENVVNDSPATFRSPSSKCLGRTTPAPLQRAKMPTPMKEPLKRAATPSREAPRASTPGRRPATPSRLAGLASPTPLMTSPRPNSGVMRVHLHAEAEKQWKLGDFRLGKPIGKGKFGNVYLAKKSGKEVTVAIKVLFKTQLQDSQALKMVSREVGLQYEHRHSNIIRLFGYFQDVKSVYLVLEYASGGELYKYLRSQPYRIISESKCKECILQIASALHHLHKNGIIHRDLKPENILVQDDGRLLLADFGSAVMVQTSDELRYTVCGTPEYLAPEMIVGAGHDCSLDMWALGILMFEMIYGRTPFVGAKAARPVDGDPHKEEALARQRMYERILSYSDRLAFPDQQLLADDSLPKDFAVSDEFKQLVAQLIKADRTQRISCEATLASSWLQ